MTSDNPRIVWADTMKALSAMMVMLYHASFQPQVKTISYILCLPAFFFVAGWFSNTGLSPVSFFRRKSLRLLIPYVVFGLLSWFLWLGISYAPIPGGEERAKWWLPLIGMISGKVELLIQNKPLWFLCCMVSVEWLYYGLCVFPQKVVRWTGGLLIGALGCTLGLFGKTGIWEITAAMTMLPLYMIGAEYRTAISERIKACSEGMVVLFVVLCCIGVVIGYLFNPEFHISTCQIGNPILFYLSALSVAGLWMGIAVLMDRQRLTPRWLQYIGQNTLIILCTHIPLFSLIKGIGMVCHVPLSFYTTNIGSVALWAISLILLFPICYCINRFFPFLIGKRTTL